MRTRRLLILIAACAALLLLGPPVGVSRPASGPPAHAATTNPPPPPPPDEPGTGNNKDPRRWPCLPLDCARKAYKICKQLHACGTSSRPGPGDQQWRATPRNQRGFAAAIVASGDPLPGPARLFQAHHIIPLSDPRFAPAQAIAWDCGIRPNDGVNGVWLRSSAAKRGTPGYRSLDGSPAQKRVYHGDTLGRRYVLVINAAMLPAYNLRTHRCNRTTALGILATLRAGLISGSRVFGSTH